MKAEQAVLGAILRKNSIYREASSLLTGDDFEHPQYGQVFDGMCRHIAAGGEVDSVTIELRFPEWGVRGLDATEPWEWLEAAPFPHVILSAAKLVRSASMRRRGRQVMSHALDELKDAGADPAMVLERVQRDLVAPGRSELESVTLEEVLKTPDEQDWVVPGLLEAKDRLILTGHEGLGKTTLVRQLLILPAAGLHPFKPERIEPVTALVVDAENTAKQWMRATRWMVKQAERSTGANPAPRIHMSLSGRLNLLDPTVLGDVHRLIDQYKPGIVFIGPLYRLALQMNTDEQIAPVIAALDSIRDRGVALVIEAHAGHAVGVNGIRDVRPRGSSALLGWPEFGYGIRKDVSDGASPDVFDFVAWRGARETRDWPLQLRRGNWELGDWPWLVEEWS